MFQLCIENDIITTDLDDLSEYLVECNDLAIKVRRFASTFRNMTSNHFRKEFCDEIEQGIKENHEEWQICLRKFLKTQNKYVCVVLGEAAVPIKSVYTLLTVIKIEPAKETAFEESSLNEIEFLRNIHKQIELETVEVVGLKRLSLSMIQMKINCCV